jgi:hypothetical protein
MRLNIYTLEHPEKALPPYKVEREREGEGLRQFPDIWGDSPAGFPDPYFPPTPEHQDAYRKLRNRSLHAMRPKNQTGGKP